MLAIAIGFNVVAFGAYVALFRGVLGGTGVDDVRRRLDHRASYQITMAGLAATRIFSAFAIPPRYQHRVLMFGVIGALVMRGAFIIGGVTLLERFHPVIYVFGAVLAWAAVKMLRGGHPQ